MPLNPLDLTIAECRALLRAVDDMERHCDDFEVSFISSNLDRTFFTERQRGVIVRMINKYEGQGIPLTWRTDYAEKKKAKVVVEDDALAAALPQVAPAAPVHQQTEFDVDDLPF